MSFWPPLIRETQEETIEATGNDRSVTEPLDNSIYFFCTFFYIPHEDNVELMKLYLKGLLVVLHMKTCLKKDIVIGVLSLKLVNVSDCNSRERPYSLW